MRKYILIPVYGFVFCFLYCGIAWPDESWQKMTTAQMTIQSDSYEESNVMDDYGIKLSKKALMLHKDLADLFLSSGEYSSALAKYNMLLTYDWDNAQRAELISKKGACHEGLKQYDMALKSYIESCELAPKNSAYCIRLANIYDVTGMDGQAMIEYKKTLELGGEKYNASLALGKLYEHKGLFSRSIECYSQALLVKSSPEIYGALSRCYEASGQWELAGSMLKQEISGNPEAPAVDSVVHLAYLYSIQQKYDDALTALNAARERDPYNEEITAHLSAVYFKKGDYTKAKEVINEFLSKKPGSPLAHFIEGFINYFEGKKDKAANEMSMTLDLKPTPMLKEYAGYILAHIKQK